MTPANRLSAVSRNELDRRTSAVRARLADIDAEALITFGCHNDYGGVPRWLTDATLGYRRVVIVHRDDMLSVVENGAAGGYRQLDGTMPGYVGVGEVRSVACFPTVAYSQNEEVTAVAEVLKARGYRRVALANGGNMPANLVEAIIATGVTIVDDTDHIDLLKAMKSPEEQGLIRKAAALQDDVFSTVVPQLRVGMRECDVSALTEYETTRRGGHCGIILVGSGGRSEPAIFHSFENRGRRIQPGDVLSLLIENGSPDGYFVELARPVVFGPIWPDLQKSFDESVILQQFLAGHYRDGAACGAIFSAYLDYVEERGIAPDLRGFSHGQGFDVVERPLIRADETMTLREGMCLSAHPPVLVRGAFASLCDNFMVGKSGGERLHGTERQIVQIDT